MRDWRAYVRERLQLPALERLRDERIVEELAGQLEDLYRAAVARGVPADEAERQAIGSVADWEALGGRIADVERGNREPAAGEWVEERERRLESGGRVGQVLAEAVRSLRLSVRSARREPGFWGVTVGILALGIGATTAIFSVVDGVLLKPLPYRHAEQLVAFQNGSFPMPRVADFIENTRSYSSLTGVWERDLDWTGGDHPVQLGGALVLPGYLELFDARVALGRSLLADDFVGGPHRAVLSFGAWRTLFGGDSGVVGRTLTLANVPVDIVGVLDERFKSPAALAGQERDVFLATDPRWQEIQDPRFLVMDVYGRLREGVAPASAQRELDGVIARLADVHPQLHRGGNGELRSVPVVQIQTAMTGGAVRLGLTLLLVAVGLLLLIACANVANLLLARGIERHHEIAVRSAMGAGRLRILAQLLAESTGFALASGALGVVLAIAGVKAFELWNPGGIPLIERVAVDARALAFALVASLVTGVVFGVAPALQAVRLNVSERLKEGGRASGGADRGGLRRSLVVAEIAIAVVLLSGAGLLFNSFLRITAVRPGFDATHLAGVELSLGRERYTEQTRVQFVQRLLQRVEQIPGVRAAAVSMTVPLQVFGGSISGWMGGQFVNDEGVEIEGQALIQPVTPGFFATIGADLRGSDLGANALTEVPIPVVVSQSLARLLFGGRDPMGRVVRGLPGRDSARTPRELRVVGVVPDLRHFGLDQDPQPTLYVPWERLGAWAGMAALNVRAEGDPAAILSALRTAVWDVDPNMPLPNVFTVPQQLARSVAAPKFYSALLLSFAAVALLLAAGGIYGSMLYAVGRRRHEFGVRAALGADRGRLMRLVLWSGARVTAAGLAIGVGGALASGRALRSMLFGVSPGDPLTLLVVALVMGVVAMAASLVPAWRAAQADPLEAMRAE